MTIRIHNNKNGTKIKQKEKKVAYPLKRLTAKDNNFEKSKSLGNLENTNYYTIERKS